MNSMLFSVRVPVLSVNTYSTWKESRIKCYLRMMCAFVM